MFIDKIRIKVEGGNGGRGAVSFASTGKPNGGPGGKGGSVILQGNRNLLELSKLSEAKSYSAPNGENGKDNQKQGHDGSDIILQVPLTTVINDEAGKPLAEIKKHGQQIVVAGGGRGGQGNHYFKHGQLATLNKFQPGLPGEQYFLTLELQLESDVVFIGLPNAGKSSMLNALTHSHVKVASYPFTTINPNVAMSGDIILIDLPGLIEGTAHGKGLGTNFLRHAKRAGLIAHFISYESDDIERDYKLIRKELQETNPELINKKELLILSKIDMAASDSELAAKVTICKKLASDVTTVSMLDDDSVTDLQKLFVKLSAR